MPATIEPLKLALSTVSRRPWWANVLLLFCAYMAIIYLPWDIFVKPVAVDQEVWFGYRFHGWLAKAAALPHWAIYAAGTVGFWRMSPNVWLWSSLYTVQVAVSMFVWPLLYGSEEGVLTSVIGGAIFLPLAFWLYRARGRYPPIEGAGRSSLSSHGSRE